MIKNLETRYRLVCLKINLNIDTNVILKMFSPSKNFIAKYNIRAKFGTHKIFCKTNQSKLYNFLFDLSCSTFAVSE
jgi:hypothetical protein